MTVSVIVPSHNHAGFVSAAVSSVLEQRDLPVDIEVIVVDDGSTDATRAVLAQMTDPRVRVISQPRRGAGAARNTGVRHAHGDVVAFLDADDLWHERKLAVALVALDGPMRPAMHFTMIQEFLDPSIAADEEGTPAPRLMRGLAASCITLRRTDLDRVGMFNEELPSGEFMDWYLRARESGLTEHMDADALVLRRIHAGNRDRIRRDERRAYPSIILAARRRTSAIPDAGGTHV